MGPTAPRADAPGDLALTFNLELAGRYEEQLKRPIRNLLAGDLARTMLIQVARAHTCVHMDAS